MREVERGSARVLALPVALFFALVYLPKAVWPTADIYTTELSPRRLEVFGVVVRFVLLAIGGVYGTLAALHLERSNPARTAWMLFGAWLSFFAIGQAGLAYYALVLHATPPLPSPGDYAFLLGYAFGIAGAIASVRVYRASGFPIGSKAQHAAIAAVAAILFVAIGVPLLDPIVHANVAFGERAINTAYPVLDFAALTICAVLIRIGLAFRGGKIWTVWGAILAGWVFMAAGDVLFAYLSEIKKDALTPLVDLTLTLGYFFAAVGTRFQFELIRSTRVSVTTASSATSPSVTGTSGTS